MLVLSLWFSALLAGLDGLILAAFAQMKRSVIFVVVEILEITAVALGAARAILRSAYFTGPRHRFIRRYPRCQQHALPHSGPYVHIPHSASARARRQGPVLLLNALESAKT